MANFLPFAMSELKSGRSVFDIRAELLRRGASEGIADRVVHEASANNRRGGIRAGIKYVLIGIGCAMLGTIITAATYANAMQEGGHYFITGGLFAFGVGYTVGGAIRVAMAVTNGK